MTYNNDNNKTIKNACLLSFLLPPPPLHRLNNVFDEKTPFVKKLGYFFVFMFATFFVNVFSLINNCFQMLNVKIDSIS